MGNHMCCYHKTKKDKEKRHAVVAPDRVRAAGEGMSSPDKPGKGGERRK